MKKAVKILIIIIVIILLIILLSLTLTGKLIIGKAIFSKFSKNAKTSQSNLVPVMITKENFHLFLESQEIIKNLPKNAAISLKLYNFNNGQRNWEETYAITKASVKKGEASNPDVIITLTSKYVGASNDLCSIIKTANKNGDLGYEIKINKAKLLFKYSGMMKYKDCF